MRRLLQCILLQLSILWEFCRRDYCGFDLILCFIMKIYLSVKGTTCIFKVDEVFMYVLLQKTVP